MAKIKRTAALVSTTEEVFSAFLSAAASRGVKDKTLNTYKQHFRSISKRLDTSIPIKDLSKSDLDDMIFQMRNSDLLQTGSYFCNSPLFFFGGICGGLFCFGSVLRDFC